MIEGGGRGSQSEEIKGQSRCPWRQTKPVLPQVSAASFPLSSAFCPLGPCLSYAPRGRAPMPPGPLSAAAAAAAAAFCICLLPQHLEPPGCPGSITHQDLTEEAALNVTLHLFLEQPPPGRPPLRLEDFLVSVPGSGHILARFPHSEDLCYLRVLLAKRRDPHTHSLLSSRQQQCTGVLVLQSGVPLPTDVRDCPSLVGPSTLSSFHIQP